MQKNKQKMLDFLSSVPKIKHKASAHTRQMFSSGVQRSEAEILLLKANPAHLTGPSLVSLKKPLKAYKGRIKRKNLRPKGSASPPIPKP